MKVKCEVTVDLETGEYDAVFYDASKSKKDNKIDYQKLVSALKKVLDDISVKKKFTSVLH